jgi:hypothetical protein
MNEEDLELKLHFNLNQIELCVLLIILYESGVLIIPPVNKKIVQNQISVPAFADAHFSFSVIQNNYQEKELVKQKYCRDIMRQIRKFYRGDNKFRVPLKALQVVKNQQLLPPLLDEHVEKILLFIAVS